MSMRANSCPCCGNSMLLRHVRQGQIYWLCQACRQEVPLLTVNRLSGNGGTQTANVKSKVNV